jgi:hypothetical protein
LTRLAFKPPKVELDPALSWVLARAFGPLEAAASPFPEPSACWKVGEELGLAPRIGGRVSDPRLTHELGSEAAALFRHEYLATAAREGVFENSIDRLAEIAQRTGTPLILLKHAALRTARFVKPGFRCASDVDVLVPQKLARPFFSALESSGWRRNGTRAYDHQLPQLLDPTDTLVEIHLHIPGVRLRPSSPFVTADDLLALGLLVDFQTKLVPTPPVLAAHAVAHGLLQNAGTPQSASPFRVIADLADLTSHAPGALALAARFLESDFDAEDFASLSELTALALSGELARAKAGALTLLRHSVASQLDPAYSQSLAMLTLTRPLSQHGRFRATLNAAMIALFPDPAAMELLHGSSRSAFQRSMDRLARPFNLMQRGARSARRRFLS